MCLYSVYNNMYGLFSKGLYHNMTFLPQNQKSRQIFCPHCNLQPLTQITFLSQWTKGCYNTWLRTCREKYGEKLYPPTKTVKKIRNFCCCCHFVASAQFHCSIMIGAIICVDVLCSADCRKSSKVHIDTNSWSTAVDLLPPTNWQIILANQHLRRDMPL